MVGRLFRAELSATEKMNLLKDKAHGVLSEQGTITADDRANRLIVTDYDEAVQRFAGFIKQFEVAAASSGPAPPDAEAAFRRRYGLDSAVGRTSAHPAEHSQRGARLEATLKETVLPEVSFDGLPLGEVLHWLRDESLKQDKETGLNFLISPNRAGGSSPEGINPATGLPSAPATEPFDMSGVIVKFTLPLRNVTMKNILDAIVKVADHPIEYTVEDYAVVFSPKREAVTIWPGNLPARPMMVPAAPRRIMNPGFPAELPESGQAPKGEAPADPAAADEPVVLEPRTFNIDFGVWRPALSKQVGPAAVGQPGDFWNSVGVPWNNAHTESGLKFATRESSAIQVEMINLAGAWSSDGLMGVKAPMLDNFNYPMNNQGGNSMVILHHVPPGKYQVYIYGHGSKNGLCYGDYTLSVGGHVYGRKTTSHGDDAQRNTKWVEGSQYVKFTGVKVGPEQAMEILIQPGGQVTDSSGRTFADAMICGLQLVSTN
jgi:hypothetical protein